MARGPYQGTFQPNLRQTIVHAPDAVVYINGETDVVGCGNCKRKFDFNRYITSIQVDLSIDSVPGNANINLSIPRHAIDDFMFDGVPVLTPMMEVEIYAKGYYLVEGMPQYYPIFWGLIGDVSDNYSNGEHSVTISCHDILKWWEICKMNVNPSFTGPNPQQSRSIFGNVFFGKNPYDVIWSLAQQSFGDVIVGTGSLISLYKEANQKSTFNAALSDIMLYWSQRFRRIRSNLLLYGVNGVAVRGDALNEKYRKEGKNKPGPFASSAVATANGGVDGSQMVFDPTDPKVTAFRTQFSQAGQVNFWQSEYQTKLELANAAKEAIGFEFYMDVTGDIVFKPPFYNLDIISNKPVSWIQDIDVIDWNFSESEAEVVTQLVLQGSFGGNVEYGFSEEATPFTSVTDYHLLRKYGWRSDTYNSEFMANPMLMFYHGLDILDRRNSRRFRGSVTIPFRPELRLGFPVYIAPKDQVWYISGISHSISFGGRAQTTLTLTARRSKFIAPNGIGKLTHTGFTKGAKVTSNPGNAAFLYSSKTLSQSAQFDLQVGDAASLPPTKESVEATAGTKNPYEPLILRHPKTGKIIGFPNAVMVYTRPFSPSPRELSDASGAKGAGTNPYTNPTEKKKVEQAGNKLEEDMAAALAASEADAFISKSYNNRYQYGLNSAGVYVYAHERKQVIGEIVLMPRGNITVKDDSGTAVKNNALSKGESTMIRPVSDERGYEVIGHFRYGRGVALRDGRLILNNGQKNAPAHVDQQLSLSGGLFETLTSQSQGLTTVVSAYPNPVDAIATLRPEELQTAAVSQSKPSFVNTGENFVDAAPLGSAAAQGLPSSVEASQLSRALTIAELTVKDSLAPGDADCVCSLGRSDLAFISVGYQFKTINSATPAETSLFDSSSVGTLSGESTTVTGSVSSAGALHFASSDGSSEAVNPTHVTPTGKELIARVDTFLSKLYSTLDDVHHEYEEKLRNGGLPPTAVDQTGDTGSTSPQQYGDLTPPFSAPNRYALGDTSAIVGDISSAVSKAGEAWNDFGENLKNKTEKARLSTEIATAKGQLSTMEKKRAELVAQKGSSGVVIGGKSVDGQIADLDSQIATLKQQVMAAEQKLNEINTKS